MTSLKFIRKPSTHCGPNDDELESAALKSGIFTAETHGSRRTEFDSTNPASALGRIRNVSWLFELKLTPCYVGVPCRRRSWQDELASSSCSWPTCRLIGSDMGTISWHSVISARYARYNGPSCERSKIKCVLSSLNAMRGPSDFRRREIRRSLGRYAIFGAN